MEMPESELENHGSKSESRLFLYVVREFFIQCGAKTGHLAS